MQLDKVAKNNSPQEFNVVIEIPMNEAPVKYELDKESNMMFVDRFMQTAMYYPANYGFIANTLSEDNDPIDVMVVSHYPVVPGAVVRSRPIGVLLMEDDGGIDEKILAVPISKLDITFDYLQELEHLCPTLKTRIVHFFAHYKDLEKGKWVKVQGWAGRLEAEQIIQAAIDRYDASKIVNQKT